MTHLSIDLFCGLGGWTDVMEKNIRRSCGSKSRARKAASTTISKIPLALSRHIASAWWPHHESDS